jgi:hypothetical protein
MNKLLFMNIGFMVCTFFMNVECAESKKDDKKEENLELLEGEENGDEESDEKKKKKDDDNIAAGAEEIASQRVNTQFNQLQRTGTYTPDQGPVRYYEDPYQYENQQYQYRRGRGY